MDFLGAEVFLFDLVEVLRLYIHKGGSYVVYGQIKEPFIELPKGEVTIFRVTNAQKLFSLDALLHLFLAYFHDQMIQTDFLFS